MLPLFEQKHFPILSLDQIYKRRLLSLSYIIFFPDKEKRTNCYTSITIWQSFLNWFCQKHIYHHTYQYFRNVAHMILGLVDILYSCVLDSNEYFGYIPLQPSCFLLKKLIFKLAGTNYCLISYNNLVNA